MLLFFFFPPSFPSSITQKLYNVHCIQTICTPNNCSTIRDATLLGYSYMQNLHTKQLLYYQRCSFLKLQYVWPQTRITVCFWTPFCAYLHAELETYRSYQTTALLLKMPIFCLRAACEIWLASYGSKHTLQPLSNTPIVRTYRHNLKTTSCIQTFYISNNCSTTQDFLVWLRVAWEIQLESFGPRHASWLFSDTTLCVCTTSLLFIMTFRLIESLFQADGARL